MALKREKMSNVDTAWWHMETPTNLMMITTIMVYQWPSRLRAHDHAQSPRAC